MYVGMGLSSDAEKGVFDRFRSLPMWRTPGIVDDAGMAPDVRGPQPGEPPGDRDPWADGRNGHHRADHARARRSSGSPGDFRPSHHVPLPAIRRNGYTKRWPPQERVRYFQPGSVDRSSTRPYPRHRCLRVLRAAGGPAQPPRGKSAVRNPRPGNGRPIRPAPHGRAGPWRRPPCTACPRRRSRAPGSCRLRASPRTARTRPASTPA